MEQGYELKLTDIRKAVLEQSQNNEMYIPLHGKHTTNPEEEPFDLAEKLQSFFVFKEELTDPKVMLLMGGTGSGKSVFSQQLHQQLWRAYTAGDPIPLWIPLPELQNPFEGAVEEVLTKYGFNDSKISEIKEKERFIFIVDGYDELHQFQNCYVTNKWEKWNAKILITCRSQALYYQKDPDKYFMPFNGEKRLPLLLRRLYVAPFAKEQISAYVKKYQELNPESKIVEEDFSKVPGLTELLTAPFLLHLAVEALPDILANQIDDEKMTQAKLYDVFIERWFTRQVEKLSAVGLLKDTEQNTKQQFWDYCKRLAQQMHEHQVSVIPYQGKTMGGRLFGKQEQTNIWELFFNEETEILRSACPLKRLGDHNYGFVHASLIEYFATRAMYEEIQMNDPDNIQKVKGDKENTKGPDISRLLIENNPPQGGIHQRIFAQEKNSIQFLADRIEMSDEFKQKMLAILNASKKSKRFGFGAANAITALVRAGVTFNGANLSGINVSGADISGGFFDRTDISHSHLNNVQMFHVWLREANLEGSEIEGVNFGEYPWFKHEELVSAFNYRDKLHRLVTACGDKIVVWDTLTNERFMILRGHNNYFVTTTQQDSNLSMEFEWEAKVCDDFVKILHKMSQKVLVELKGHNDKVNCVNFNQSGEFVVSGSDDKTVRIWELVSGKAIAVLRGHDHRVSMVEFSPDSKRVISLGGNTVRIWDVASGYSFARLRGHAGVVNSVQINPHSECVVTGSEDKTVKIWNMLNGVEIRNIRGHEKGVWSVAYSPDGEWIVSGSEDKTVRLWNVKNGNMLIHGHECAVYSVQFSPDGKYVVSGDWNNKVHINDLSSGEIITVSEGHKLLISTVMISPNRQWVASGSWDKTVRIEEALSKKLTAILVGHEYPISSVHFSLDSRLVVSGSWDMTVRVWEVVSGQCVTVFHGHEGWVTSVKFSCDGQCVLSGSRDMTIRVWSIANHKCLSLLKLHNQVQDFSYNATGVLVVGFDDGSLECWQNVGNKHDFCWQLNWSTDIDSRSLNVQGLRTTAVIGVSDQNRQMLERRGAKIVTTIELQAMKSSVELISEMEKTSRNSIHLESFLLADKLEELRCTIMKTIIANDIYIPLYGKQTISPNENPFDLSKKIMAFFIFDKSILDDPKVMVLMGDAGCGKSVFTKRLHQQLWGAYKYGGPIPLWIPLPELQNPFEGAVEEVLTKYGFSQCEIQNLKEKEKFIFLVDGYDELHQFRNCYVTNSWSEWDCKVLITCRSQIEYHHPDFEKYFMPYEEEKKLPKLLRKLFVVPFRKEQITEYLERYQTLNSNYNISIEDFDEIPGLINLIRLPYLLGLILEAYSYIQEVPHNQKGNQIISSAQLLDLFIECWWIFKKVSKLPEIELLSHKEVDYKLEIWGYFKKLNQEMQNHEISVIPIRVKRSVGHRLFGKPQDTSSINKSIEQEFTFRLLIDRFEQNEVLRRKFLSKLEDSQIYNKKL